MSFQDIYHGLEAGLLPPPPPPALQTVVSHSVFQINTCVATLWRLADELAGCQGDARKVRERVRRSRAEATRLARNTARKLADAGGVVEPKLAAEFEASLRALQRVQERIIAADRRETTSYHYHDAFPSQTGPYNGTGTSYDHHQRSIQMQQQQLVESRRAQELVHLEKEAAFNAALVQDREQEICKIQQEITEINEIFRDLAKLVHGQHEAIEIVECNLGAPATETARAEAELTEAAMTQRRKTRSETDCMVIAAVVLVVLILVLLYLL